MGSFRTKEPVSETEELAAQRTAAIGRGVAMIAIAIMLDGPHSMADARLLLRHPLLYSLHSAGQPSRRPNHLGGEPWHQYAFVAADFALLTFVILYP